MLTTAALESGGRAGRNTRLREFSSVEGSAVRLASGHAYGIRMQSDCNADEPARASGGPLVERQLSALFLWT